MENVPLIACRFMFGYSLSNDQIAKYSVYSSKHFPPRPISLLIKNLVHPSHLVANVD